MNRVRRIMETLMFFGVLLYFFAAGYYTGLGHGYKEINKRCDNDVED